MGETLEALHRLQAVELQLAEIRRERDAKARRVEYHKRQVRTAEEKFQQNRETIRERQARLDTLQLEVSSREDAINRHRQLLNRAKTNREYAAILTAMNTEKADNAKLETEILQLMDFVQNLKNEAAAIEAQKARLLEDVTRAEEALRNYDAECQQQDHGLRADREECAEKVPPSALASFTRVAEHHDGEAMVPIAKLHPKRDEYICSGCNITVTLEVVNALQTRDELQVCKVCGRILYLESPETQRSRA